LQEYLGAANVDFAPVVNGYDTDKQDINFFIGLHTGLVSPSFHHALGKGSGLSKPYKLVVIADSHPKWDDLARQGEPKPNHVGGAVAILLQNTSDILYPVGIPSQPVVGTGHYLPGKPISNLEFTRTIPTVNIYRRGNLIDKKPVETSPEWIMTRMGAGYRHFSADDEDCPTLGKKAWGHAEHRYGLDPSNIKILGVATETGDGDVFRPSIHGKTVIATSARLNRALGANAEYMFDVRFACAGNLMNTYLTSTAPVTLRGNDLAVDVSVEQLDRVEDILDKNKDRDQSIGLFGSGAGILVRGAFDSRFPDAGLTSFISSSNPFDGALWYIYKNIDPYPEFDLSLFDDPDLMPHGNPYGIMRMPEGLSVFKLATRTMIENAHLAMRLGKWREGDFEHGLTKEQIDLLNPHQANSRIIEAVAKRDEFTPDQLLNYVKLTSNISSASTAVSMSMREAEWGIPYLIRDGKGIYELKTEFGSGVVSTAGLIRS
ncbi:MAG: 3-oxoacyl-[acyl-carrier-protein] synthase III C-terminal domain-containing protein, partial [Nanoarchaeota archaeon]